MPVCICQDLLRKGQADKVVVELPAHFLVWLASNEAAFLRNKFVWANWDVQELKDQAEKIQSSSVLTISLNGVDM